MLMLQVRDRALEQQLTELLDRQFHGDIDAMLSEFVKLYKMQRNRLQFSGILRWDQDPLAYQRELRGDWD